MAQYLLHRTTRQYVQLPIDELFDRFGIRYELDDYLIDIWLRKRGDIGANEWAEHAADEALLEWLLDHRLGIQGGDNRDGSQFEELHERIKLSEEEQCPAVKRLRELLRERDARDAQERQWLEEKRRVQALRGLPRQ